MEPEIKIGAEGKNPKKFPKTEFIIGVLLAGAAFYFFFIHLPSIQNKESVKQIEKSGVGMVEGLKRREFERTEKKAQEEAKKRTLLQEPDEEELLRLEVERQNEAGRRIQEEEERLMLQQQRLEEEVIKLEQQEKERIRQEEKLMEERLRKERELMQ